MSGQLDGRMSVDAVCHVEPVNMTYIEKLDSNRFPISSKPAPYIPTTNLTDTEQQLDASRGVYPHFHRPFNDHSRFLVTASPQARAAFRDSPRLAPPPWDGSTPDFDLASSRRPASAPSTGRRGGGGAGGSGGPGDGSAGAVDLGIVGAGGSLLDNMVTKTGTPCYTVPALVSAHLESGTPLGEAAEGGAGDWRVARVQTYPVPPSRVGYGEGGVRPFHQDYRHYKYFGFAGRGAKTSWAHNPKYSRTYADVFTSERDSGAVVSGGFDEPSAPPLQDSVGGPRRPLTPRERELVAQFSWHNYEAEGVPSSRDVAQLIADVAVGRTPDTRTLRHLKVRQPAAPPHQPHTLTSAGAEGQQRKRWQQGQGQRRSPAVDLSLFGAEVSGRSSGGGGGRGGGAGLSYSPRSPVRRPLSAPRGSGGGGSGGGSLSPGGGGAGAGVGGAIPFSGGVARAVVLEPYHTKVDLQLRRSLPPETDLYGNSPAARVTTYRQVASPYAGEVNTSPNHGSQSPWHQRYGHYKYSGFAGKGATSSWARNPKYAFMYDRSG